jgi:hypothetical protein
LNHAVPNETNIGIKEQPPLHRSMGFFKRFFGKQRDESSDEANNAAEQNMQSQLKAQYHRDIDEDVSSLESILDDSEDQPEESVVLPAPDYDEPNVTVDDVLVESEMESFSEKNTVEHASVEDIGNHLESATVVGDVSSEVSFE